MAPCSDWHSTPRAAAPAWTNADSPSDLRSRSTSRSIRSRISSTGTTPRAARQESRRSSGTGARSDKPPSATPSSDSSSAAWPDPARSGARHVTCPKMAERNQLRSPNGRSAFRRGRRAPSGPPANQRRPAADAADRLLPRLPRNPALPLAGAARDPRGARGDRQLVRDAHPGPLPTRVAQLPRRLPALLDARLRVHFPNRRPLPRLLPHQPERGLSDRSRDRPAGGTEPLDRCVSHHPRGAGNDRHADPAQPVKRARALQLVRRTLHGTRARGDQKLRRARAALREPDLCVHRAADASLPQLQRRRHRRAADRSPVQSASGAVAGLPSVSRALGTQHGTARSSQKAGLEQQRHDLRLTYRIAVETLDREPLRTTPLHVFDQRGECAAHPGFLRLSKRDERAPSTLHEERGLAAEQDDLRAGHPRGAGSRPLRPRQRGAVGLRRVGRREHERFGLLVLSRSQFAQPLDRSRKRELRAAETLDEVAAAAHAERLQRTQLAVDGAVAAGNSLAADTVPRDDPLALEQKLGERPRIGLPQEEPAGERPTPLRRGDSCRALAREAARPPAGSSRRLVAASGSERRPCVVRHLACPDEVPERQEGDLGLELGRRYEVVPELGAAPEGCANRTVGLPFGRRRRSGAAERGRVITEVAGDAVETGPDPHNLTRGAELVELARVEPGNAPR